MVNILIIDDNDTVRKSVKRVLVKQGYSVDEAVNSSTGMKIINQKKIDLVISDVVMPGGGGVELLLGLNKKKDIQKILITGKFGEDTQELAGIANKYGAKHILHKPFKKIDLLNAVNDVLLNK